MKVVTALAGTACVVVDDAVLRPKVKTAILALIVTRRIAYCRNRAERAATNT